MGTRRKFARIRASGRPTLAESGLLVVNELHAGYGDTHVLHGISMSVAPGETVSIIGPNGAGKSTLLRAIFGMADVHAGSVSIGGHLLTGRDTRSRLKAGAALVLQGRCNFPEMTVEENLEMGGFTIARSTIPRRRQQVYDLLPVLQDKAHVKGGRLSGGQQQLLEVGMVLMILPRLLMLDEPTLGLDPRNSGVVLDQVRHLAASGLGLLIVEQNVRQVLAVSDRALVLADGESHMEGPAESVLEDPTVASLYLGGSVTAQSPEGQ